MSCITSVSVNNLEDQFILSPFENTFSISAVRIRCPNYCFSC